MISELCIFDLSANETRVVLRHDGHIEAPNWHPDGYLIVNGGGQIFQVPLISPHLVPLDTGLAKACNNDHGISPDGATLVISDQTDFGQSCIYTLPVSGGLPTQITPKMPSYWHGCSPDGETLTYVGRREGAFALFTCPASGGEETCVTSEFDHIDGPDFAPDGKWIWFNGERDGKVELWRIQPDGESLMQMTDDHRVNWFPHPSPDGERVVYLAYPEGTEGHPANLNVELRIIASSGGSTRRLCTLFGGQGTINVPSWAPDSQRFAFMRYVADGSRRTEY